MPFLSKPTRFGAVRAHNIVFFASAVEETIDGKVGTKKAKVEIEQSTEQHGKGDSKTKKAPKDGKAKKGHKAPEDDEEAEHNKEKVSENKENKSQN